MSPSFATFGLDCGSIKIPNKMNIQSEAIAWKSFSLTSETLEMIMPYWYIASGFVFEDAVSAE